MHQVIRVIILAALGLTGTMLVLGGWQAIAGLGKDVTKAAKKAIEKNEVTHAT